MPTLGRIRDGISSWDYIPLKYFVFSYYEDNEPIDVFIDSPLADSVVKWKRDEDCWLFEGQIGFVEKDYKKAVGYLGKNYDCYEDNGLLFRIEVIFPNKILVFNRSDNDVLEMSLNMNGQWSKDLMCFVFTINWYVILKRDANFDNIFVSY